MFFYGIPNEKFDIMYVELYYQLIMYGDNIGARPESADDIQNKFFINIVFNAIRLRVSSNMCLRSIEIRSEIYTLMKVFSQ